MRRAAGGARKDTAQEARLRTEVALLRLAAQSGVPVPRVLDVLSLDQDAGEGMGLAILMEWLDGETLGARIVRSESLAAIRPLLARRCGEILARLHAIDWRAHHLDELLETTPPRQLVATTWQRYQALAHPQPMIDFTARWLLDHLPSGGELSLVHGDFRIGNVMFDERGLTGVLDWELAHVGDPLEDLGWLAVRAWRFGANDRPIGGLCSRAAFWAAYEREGGERVDPKVARYWEIFGNWKWAVICVMQAAGHRASGKRDVELAAIGRRVADVELELLDLIEEADRAG